MDFYTFWRGLSDDEQSRFANAVGLSKRYIAIHLIYAYKTPRLQTLQKMADASHGKLTFAGLCDFFAAKSVG